MVRRTQVLSVVAVQESWICAGARKAGWGGWAVRAGEAEGTDAGSPPPPVPGAAGPGWGGEGGSPECVLVCEGAGEQAGVRRAGRGEVSMGSAAAARGRARLGALAGVCALWEAGLPRSWYASRRRCWWEAGKGWCKACAAGVVRNSTIAVRLDVWRMRVMVP